MERTTMIEVAARRLGVGPGALTDTVRDLPDENAIYAWTTGRCGGAIIVSTDGSTLFATSAATYDAHLEAFRAGRRSAPYALADPA